MNSNNGGETTAKHSSEAAFQIKFSSKEKFDNILRSISAVTTATRASSLNATASRAFSSHTTSIGASKLLTSYSQEITCAILEETAILAKHRGVTEIGAEDINFILVKKFGMDIPQSGMPVCNPAPFVMNVTVYC